MLSGINYSLTSPYGHLSIMDSSFDPRNARNHTFPARALYYGHLCKVDNWFCPFGVHIMRFNRKRIVFAIKTACYINLTVGDYHFNRMG